MDVSWFRRLYGHMEWGDAIVWRQVLVHGPSTNDPFIRESLLHLHFVQRAYLSGWTGTSLEPVTLDHFPSLEALRDWGRGFYPEVTAYFETLHDGDLDVDRPVKWADMIEEAIGQPPVAAPLADIVFQVASHGIHHRAQINRRIRELGGEPGFIDYVAWAWLGCPNADWS